MTMLSEEERQRAMFEEWYATHAFNYERDPIGSRECAVRWEGWLACYRNTAQSPAAEVKEVVMSPAKQAWDDWFDLVSTDGNGHLPSFACKACFDAFLLESGKLAHAGVKIAVRAGLMAAHAELYRIFPPTSGRAEDRRADSLSAIKRISESMLSAAPSPPAQPEIAEKCRELVAKWRTDYNQRHGAITAREECANELESIVRMIP